MSDQQTVTPGSKPLKGRSPSYPGISLPTAIDRARTIYEYAQHHTVPLATVTSKWGYKKPTTGPASVTYAALKKYGLLTDEGAGEGRVARLTDLAVRTLHSNPEQDEAIREAALSPPIMREWWNRFGTNLPPDESLRWEFAIQGPFTETGLADFVRVYRETIAFAKLDYAEIESGEAAQPDRVREDDALQPDPGSHSGQPARRRQRRADGVVTYQVPLRPGEDIVVEFPYVPSGDDFDFFVSMLQAVKARLVAAPDRSTEVEGSGAAS
jgi:hypothetical protein